MPEIHGTTYYEWFLQMRSKYEQSYDNKKN